MPTATINRTKVAGSCFGLFCLALVLAAYSADHPQVAQVGTYLVRQVTTPFQELSRWSLSSVVGVWSNYLNLLEVRSENERMQQRLSALEAQNSQLLEFEKENERLRALLVLREQHGLQGVVAGIIGYNPSNWVESITIDRGSSDGLQRGMAVVERQGIVGHIINLTPHSAEVLLITDHASGVDALVQSTRARGVIEGSGGGMCKLEYVVKEEEVKVGDRVITSGMDGIFPKGLLVGIVSNLDREKRRMFQRIEVRPAVAFTKLEQVFVVTSQTAQSSAAAEKDQISHKTVTERAK